MARLKGAEFAVLSYFEKPGELENRVADIQQQFQEGCRVQGQVVHPKVRCSISVNSEVDSLEELYRLGKKKLEK